MLKVQVSKEQTYTNLSTIREYKFILNIIHPQSLNFQKQIICFQKDLFSHKLDGELGRDRRVSLASQDSMKTKWLKAFKNLKTSPEVEK